jgi:hypothetical protein
MRRTMVQEVSDVAGTTWQAQLDGTRSVTYGGSGGEPHVGTSARTGRIDVGADGSGDVGDQAYRVALGLCQGTCPELPEGVGHVASPSSEGEEPWGG